MDVSVFPQYHLWIKFLPLLCPFFWSVVCLQQPVDGSGSLRVWQTLGQGEACAALHGGEACQCSDVEVREHTWTVFPDIFSTSLCGSHMWKGVETLPCIKRALFGHALVACVNQHDDNRLQSLFSRKAVKPRHQQISRHLKELWDSRLNKWCLCDDVTCCVL